MAERLRRLCLLEEREQDSVHKACYVDVFDERKDQFVEYLGLFHGYPVAYLGIMLCDCGVLLWRYIYVPKEFRNLGVGLEFIRKMLKLLYKNETNYKIEICYNVENRSIASLARHFGFHHHYVTEVADLEELLKK